MVCLESECTTLILLIGMIHMAGVRIKSLHLFVFSLLVNRSRLLLHRLFDVVYPHAAYASREYPTGWVGIDGNDEPSEKDFY